MVNRKNIVLTLIIACTTSCALAMKHDGPTREQLLIEKAEVIERQWGKLQAAKAANNIQQLELLAMTDNIKMQRAAQAAIRQIEREQYRK